ncbi:MAG: hypothetical protein ABJD07_09195 [Gemmatimonadaceae bacterium]
MWIEPPPIPCRTLGQYITLLIERLQAQDPEGVARIRALVGRRGARVSLDDESVIVRFARARLVLERNGPRRVVDGEGTTDRQTVLALLDGYAEVVDVLLDGRLAVRGDVENIARMFQSIEVLIDGATRVPGLQQLARDFRLDPCRDRALPHPSRDCPPRSRVSPSDVNEGEMALLARLDLVP